MTKSEIMKLAHAEARKFQSRQRCSYAEALSVGLRRAHNTAMHARMQAAILAEPKAPQFMWLRGF